MASTATTSAAPPTAAVVRRRMHISGLNAAQCSTTDLRARMAAFGLEATSIEGWPPGQDGVGKTKDWCFVSVQGPEAGVKRAMQTLSGTTWKGHKLRLGLARERPWGDAAANGATGEDKRREEEGEGSGKGTREKVDKEREEKEAKKERKRIERMRKAGFESKDIGEIVNREKVEKGEWGWKKTPAGHLIRPMHMRPDRPVPRPTINDAPKNTEDDKKKRRSKGKSSGEPAKRARRCTIDPTRYGAVHVSGLLLDDGTEGAKGEWVFESEDEEGGEERWLLKDRKGKILREESIAKKQVAVIPVAQEEKEQSVETTQSDSDSETSESDSSQSSPSQGPSVEVSPTIEEEKSLDESATPFKVDSFPAYDPDEEETFSEGYQEAVEDSHALPAPGEDERSRYLSLLQNMFGGVEKPMDANEAARLRQAQEEKNSLFQDSDDEQRSDYGMDEEDDNVHEDEANVVNGGSESDDTTSGESDDDSESESDSDSDSDSDADSDSDLSVDNEQPQSTESPSEQVVESKMGEKVRDQEEVSNADIEDGTKGNAQQEKKEQESASMKEQHQAISEEEQKRIDRRAAFLTTPAPTLDPQTQTEAFTPYVRFDPGVMEEEDDVLEDARSEPEAQANASEMVEDPSEASKVQVKSMMVEPNQISMSSLKDMFRPQEDAGGFSLMGNLDLDLDEELNFEPDEDQTPAAIPISADLHSTNGSGVSLAKQPSGFDFDPDTPFFFPAAARRSDESFPSTRPDVYDVLRTTTTSSVQPFYRTATEDEIRSRWQEARGQLTSDYRKRHKDALRKKKRSRMTTV